MPIFKPKKSKDSDHPDDLNNLPSVKQLDTRLEMDGYRDFFTLKFVFVPLNIVHKELSLLRNYWKTVNRRSKEAEGHLMYRSLTKLFIASVSLAIIIILASYKKSSVPQI